LSKKNKIKIGDDIVSKKMSVDDMIKEVVKKRKLDSRVEGEIKKVVDDVKKEKISKSKGIVLLYEKGLFIGELSRILGVRYNFGYNVISDLYEEVRKEKVSGKGKSEKIRKLLKEGFSVRGIVEEFMKENEYVNINMVYKIRKGEEKKKNKIKG